MTTSPIASSVSALASNQDAALPTATARPGNTHSSAKALKPCRFFGTDSGCRLGQRCPFLHDDTQLPESSKSVLAEADTVVPDTVDIKSSGRQAATKPVESRVVQRPTPRAEVQNPREFQLGQIRRRFKPKEYQLAAQHPDGTTVLDFGMKPSDPDFPFEMDVLQCSLIIPPTYPGSDPASRPSLRVKNNDIPRGFAINVENGFRRLVEERKGATLLALVSALDKNLEVFLSEKKAETVKLVANADRRHIVCSLPLRSVGASPSNLAVEPTAAPSNSKSSSSSASEQPLFTATQKAEAQTRREMETRQLESRMGRLPFFKKSGDGIAYTIPIEPRKRLDLPLSIQAVKVLQLFVPMLYPLQCCRIALDGVAAEDSRNVEVAFENRARQARQMTLMSHLNYLAQNMHLMAKESPDPQPKSDMPYKPVAEGKQTEPEPDHIRPPQSSTTMEDDRTHIKVIPRPPEWSAVDESSGSSETDDDSYDSTDASEEGGIELDPDIFNTTQSPLQTAERGTAISFPFIELYGIELLEVTTLNLTVKCERCKDTSDITGLKSGVTKAERCKKCASNLVVTFRHQPVHMNSVRAGFLDLEACNVVDMLPSAFIPTCSNCSTPYPSPGIISVRGETTTNVCRECHQRFTFKIPDVKFLRITSSHLPPSSGPRRKRETLGLTAGTELPKRGRCKHYTKSYRWFRFSCCSKVYPCDKCHDEAEEHPNEHANRMICGLCSREQNYRPEDCGICHAGLIGKRGSGFWEGGKGTRDRVRMSRKDKRKYRRIGGATT